METLQECYTVYGSGGWEACNVVQDKLQLHGLCSYSRWEPAPPNWRFFYETNLKPRETIALLGKYAVRYHIQVK